MLAQPEAARRIGRSGRQALLRSHSWQHWWERVAGQLETRGKHLDLAAPPREALAGHRPSLAMAMTGLAHLHEGQGQPAEADAYFQQVLSWYPGDYAALAGMARRSPDPRTRQSYWRRAVQDQPARHQLWHGLFPTRVLGPSGTAFRDEAGIQLLLGAMNLGDYATAADALYGLAGLNSRFALPFIRQLLRVGEVASAARCLTAALGFWPDDVHLLGLQATWSAEAGPGQ
ncbi:MAG: hypothetical protein H7338_00560 [Candidatus Sericytochromatia bacterium]|nr:hypothetical protein [Candidatus Sericytochromatia bacterium]